MARIRLLHSLRFLKPYTAPWSKLFVIVSVLATGLCRGLSFEILSQTRGINVGPVRTLGWPPAALVLVSAWFAIRGCAVTPDAVLVRRWFWTTRLPRAGLQPVTFAPQAMREIPPLRHWST
jgi:hypothetical protein